MNYGADKGMPDPAREPDAGDLAVVPGTAELDSHKPWNINGLKLAVRVVRGHVDLFAVRIGDRRHHVLRVEGGAMLVGLPRIDDGHAGLWSIIAVGGPSTEVELFERERCCEREQIEFWAGHLARSVSIPPITGNPMQNDVGSKVALGAGEMLRAPARRTAWLEVEHGSVKLMGRPCAWRPEDRILLPPGTWIEAESDTVLAVHDSSAITDEAIWAAVDSFHWTAMACLVDKIHAEEEAEAGRLAGRLRVSAQRSNRIFSDLAGAIGRSSPLIETGGRSSRDLFAACQEIGRSLGVTIVRPPNRPAGGGEVAEVFAVAEASRLRARRVLLRAQWWRRNAGALIAWQGEDRRPVAIVEGQRGRPVMIDPNSGEHREITATAAEELSAEAMTFYRSLAPRPLSVLDLFRHSLGGSARDGFRIFLAAACIAGMSLAAPLILKVLIDSVVPRAELDQLVICALALAVVAFMTAGFQAMQGIAILRLQSSMDLELQSAIADRMLRLPIAFFKQFSAGDLVDRALGIQAVREIVTGRALRGLLACISALFSFGLMFYFNPWLAIIAFVLASFRAVVVVATGLVRLSHERINFDLQGSLRSLVLQFLTGIAKLRIANATVHALAIWSERFAAQRRQFVASQRAANLLKVLEAAFPGIATMIVFAVAENIAKDTLLRDLGTFLAFIAALGLSIAAIGEWATAAGELLIAIPRFARLRPIIANAPEISTDRKSPGILGGSVELAQVAFRYAPSGPRVLENVSLSVAENEYIAIVGPSGSGKSTIFRLLLGFERPESGVIYFDGKAAETLDISAVRRQIGVVLQNSRTISGSIYENICGGVLLPVDEVWDAVRLVGLDNDINAMPMGLHTVVSEGANTLSGGQRQRLLIARALIHKPKILLMDEATSALDNRTQAIVSSSLASLNVTRIVIAHRLTTVQSADRIIVLAGGKIIQTGNFEELSSKPGMFADFTRRQLL